MRFERLAAKSGAPKLAVWNAEFELSPVRKLRGCLLDPPADKGVRFVEPGVADHEAGRLDLRRFEVRNERLHHPRAFGNVSRHRSRVVETRGQGKAAVDRDQTEARLETD